MPGERVSDGFKSADPGDERAVTVETITPSYKPVIYRQSCCSRKRIAIIPTNQNGAELNRGTAASHKMAMSKRFSRNKMSKQPVPIITT